MIVHHWLKKNNLQHPFYAGLFFLASIVCSGESSITHVSRGPGRSWEKLPTRTLADLPPTPLDQNLGRYGGTPTASPQPSGFFRVTQQKGRWWLVDPEGLPYHHRGIASIRETRTSRARAALQETFGTSNQWAKETSQLLRERGFNGTGPWCNDTLLKQSQENLAYSKMWNFMSTYGKRRGGTFQKAGHLGYPGDCPFIFDPEFSAFCEQHAEQLAETKDDPWLLGHFTDNELPWNIKMLDRYLALPKTEHGYLAASKWLQERGKKQEQITDRDRADFVGFAAETYFSIVTQAILKHDPNHLILGSRFHGSALRIPALFEAAGRHLDVISVNYYHAWTPEIERMQNWSTTAKKPILITEWYAKGQDSGLANTSGAGWLVKTQKDRGKFYQNFTLALLESQVCVGWHWFRYADNDPSQKGVDPSNLDANKGIVTSDYQPYPELLDAMEAVNKRSYGLIQFFQQQ